MTGKYELIWANDNDPDAVATYSSNFHHKTILKDIREIDSKDIPDSEVIIGGFPCQGFSLANTGRRVDDERNGLYLEMLRVVSDKKPMAFVAENVKGLAQMEKGEILQRIIGDFADAGYIVQFAILNAADYGVPQKRERVFLVGMREDLGTQFHFPEPTHSKTRSENYLPWRSVGNALESIPDPDGDHNLLNHTYSKYKLRFNGYLGHRPIDPNAPAPTVTGRGDNKGGVVVLHHPSNIRRMSVRELAVIQSFPLDFYFKCNQSAAYRLIANAVAPLMGKAIADSLAQALGVQE